MNIDQYSLPSAGMPQNQHIYAVMGDIALLVPVFLFIFTLRGFLEALTAKLMGDDTAEQEGFLTLNPLAHVDVSGLFIIVIILFVMGGIFYSRVPRILLLLFLITLGVRWRHPVPINENNFKNYRLGGFLTTMSGSLGNLVIAFFATGLLKLTTITHIPHYMAISFAQICHTIIEFSLFLGVLNLMPVPPFDLGRALRYLTPEGCHYIFDILEHYSIFIILGLFCLPVVSTIFFKNIYLGVMLLRQMMFAVFF